MTEEVQGPFRLIEVINRRNGIQYGTKWVKVGPKKPKAPKEEPGIPMRNMRDFDKL